MAPVAPAVVAAGRSAITYVSANAPELLEKARKTWRTARGTPVAANAKEFLRVATTGAGPAVAAMEHLARAGVSPKLMLQDVSPEFMNSAEMQTLVESLAKVHQSVAAEANKRGTSIGVASEAVYAVRAVNDEISEAMRLLGLRTSKQLWSLIKVLRVLNETDIENYSILTGR